MAQRRVVWFNGYTTRAASAAAATTAAAAAAAVAAAVAAGNSYAPCCCCGCGQAVLWCGHITLGMRPPYYRTQFRNLSRGGDTSCQHSTIYDNSGDCQGF